MAREGLPPRRECPTIPDLARQAANPAGGEGGELKETKVKMILQASDYQRAAIHESGHAFAALRAGIDIYGMTLQGNQSQPGAVWHVLPNGKTAESDKECAGRLIDLFTGGSMGEEVFYGNCTESWLDGEHGDRAMIDYLTYQHLRTEREEEMVQQALQVHESIPYDQLRNLLPNFPWGSFDQHMQARAAAVKADIETNKDSVERLAKHLLADGFVSGRDICSTLGLRWTGQVRTAAWQNLP